MAWLDTALGSFSKPKESYTFLLSAPRIVTHLSGLVLDRVDTGGVIGTLEGRQGCLRTSCTNIISGQTGSPIITKLQAESFNSATTPAPPPPSRFYAAFPTTFPFRSPDDTLNFQTWDRSLGSTPGVSGTTTREQGPVCHSRISNRGEGKRQRGERNERLRSGNRRIVPFFFLYFSVRAIVVQSRETLSLSLSLSLSFSLLG